MEQSGRKHPRMTANRWTRKPRGYLRAAALGCIPLRTTRDGKEGVNGSSPLEGSAKAPHTALFL
jgi:hypothetical protein